MNIRLLLKTATNREVGKKRLELGVEPVIYHSSEPKNERTNWLFRVMGQVSQSV